MDILTVLTTGTLCIVCFLIGARTGQQVQKGEPIKAPEINPFKAHKEREERKEAEREKEKIETILHNIDAYDGTSNGQLDIPR